MTNGVSPASAIADAVLSERGYRRRLELLKRRSLEFGPELVEEFRDRSSAEFRSNPREAIERAKLGGIVAFALGDPAGLIARRPLRLVPPPEAAPGPEEDR